MKGTKYDAVVIGAGPNGLAAAITLAEAGWRVLILEGRDTPGGGCRTAQLTLPGFHHDVCAAIHPMGIASPFFKQAKLPIEWRFPEIQVAHPLEDGRAALLYRSIDETASDVGDPNWARVMEPFGRNSEALFAETLKPVRFTKHPLLMARFGLLALQSCERLARNHLRTDAARALFAGNAAHSFLPLDWMGSGSFGIMLALTGHVVGWPCAQGGSQKIIDAMVARFIGLGGEIQTNQLIKSLREVPDSRAVLFDLAPRQVAQIAADDLPANYKKALLKYRAGPGVFKIDWALSAPIPWRNEGCRRAGTVHVGGTLEEISIAESASWTKTAPEKPFVLVAQQSIFDSTRAPAGKHTGWGYCHVPHGCAEDMTERIEAQIERFAPGFRDTILARHVMRPADYASYNPTMTGGDIGGGANTLWQFMFRPVVRWNPYSTPNARLFLCSSSTPPGGGVHGMCGYWAARTALNAARRRS